MEATAARQRAVRRLARSDVASQGGPGSCASTIGPSKLGGMAIGGPVGGPGGRRGGPGGRCSVIGNQGTGTEVSSTTASPRVGDNFAAPPLDPPRTNPDDASEGYMPAACRVCALAEAEGSLCDFAPRDKGWWSDAITAPQHQKISLELWSALRLQKTQRTVLTISTSHNQCAINASLMTIAAAAAEAASLEAATTRDAMVESIKDDGATPRSSLRKARRPPRFAAGERRGRSCCSGRSRSGRSRCCGGRK